jgi:hypothetical protein
MTKQRKLKLSIRLLRRSSLLGICLILFFADDVVQVIRDYDFYQFKVDEDPVYTDGIVLGNYETEHSVAIFTTNAIEYKYQNQETGEMHQWQSFTDNPGPKVGDTVRVKYWKQNPKVSRIRGMRGSYLTDMSFRHFFLVPFGISLILIGWLKGSKEISRLESEGKELKEGLNKYSRWLFPEYHPGRVYKREDSELLKERNKQEQES